MIRGERRQGRGVGRRDVGRRGRPLSLEALEARQLMSVTPDNVPRSYQSPIETLRTPQFVSLGWDDNTDPAGIEWVLQALEERRDAMGGALTTSFYMNSVGFVAPAGSGGDTLVSPGDSEGSLPGTGAAQASLVAAFKKISAAGHEVGNHTYDHHGQVLAEKGGWDGMVRYLSNEATVDDWKKFLNDCSAALADPGGQDLSKVTGFRAPFLEYGKNLFPALSQLGFTYDCSIEAVSDDQKRFPFPYTLDTGSYDHATGMKASPENPNRFDVPATPGLWEVPAYALRIPDAVEEDAYGLVDMRARLKAAWPDVVDHVTGFDYNVFLGSNSEGAKVGPGLTGPEVLGLLKYNLDIRLSGNRAPLCFGTHSQYYLDAWAGIFAPQVTVAEMRRTITDFVDYARAKPEVRIVSGQHIVDWMRAPTPLDDRPQILAPGPVTEVVLNQPRVELGNLFTATTTQVRVNDGPWTRIDVDKNGSAPLMGLRQGANTAVFRQLSTEGVPSANQTVKIRFDSIAPPRPLVALRRSGPGGFTNDPALRVARVETDARIEYSINGGVWSDVYAPADGPTAVRIRTVDDAGNASPPTRPVRFTLDRSAAAPAVALRDDSGEDGDRITTDGRLVVTGVERGALVQYSADDGRTWTRRFAAAFGRNEVLVRQRDRVGNYSEATRFTFTKLFASGDLDLQGVALWGVNFTPPSFYNSGKVGVGRAGPDSIGQRWFVFPEDRRGGGVSFAVRLVHPSENVDSDLKKSFWFMIGPQMDTEDESPPNFGLVAFQAGFRSDNTFVLRETQGRGELTVGQTKEFGYPSIDDTFRVHFERIQWNGDGKPWVVLHVKGVNAG